MNVAHAVAQAYFIAAAVVVAGILHMMVVKQDLFAALSVPLDGGRTLRGRRIFGDNKTWRGVVVMVAASAAGGALQGALFGDLAARAALEPLPYGRLLPFLGDAAKIGGYALVAALLGLGYVLGELPNSFLKRQLDIGPGDKGRGFAGALAQILDHSDSVVGSMAAVSSIFGLGWRFFLISVVGLSLLHAAMVALLYVLRVKRRL